jgi:opacity protein-like surface antigen
MKKQFITPLLLIFLISAANAQAALENNFFIGADFNQSNIRHRLSLQTNADNYPPVNINDYIQKDNSSHSFGVNVGSKLTVNNVYFIAPEIFYDRLSSESYDFYKSDVTYPAPYDRINIKDRLGVKLNLGYNLSHLTSALQLKGSIANQLSKLSIFANAGITRISYEVALPSLHLNAYRVDVKDRSIEIAPIFGFGFNYAISENWSSKFAYDVQKFAIRYLDNGMRDNVEIETLRVGIAYIF